MAEPIYSSNNKLTWKFENIWNLDRTTRYSDEFDIEGVKWKIGIKKQNQDWVHAVLNCSVGENQKAWICSVDTQFFLLINQVLSDKTVLGENQYCNERNNEIGQMTSVRLSTIISPPYDYIENGPITVQLNFSFIFQNFSNSIENQTDIILKVEETEIHYKKEFLCSQSKYFFDLLKEESDITKKEITLDDDIKLDEFMLFLIALQPKQFLSTSKLFECLELADKFKVDSIIEKISQRLFSYFEVTRKEKISLDVPLLLKYIQFAEKYNYNEVVLMAIHWLKTSKDVKDVSNLAQFKNLKNETKLMMFMRLLDFL